MFGIDQVISDGIKSILFIVALLIIFYRCGGGTILLRIILRAAGIRFKDNVLGRADDEIFYTQKFRLLNGVNVKNTQDAKLISKGILSGELSKSNFHFSSFFGAIGKNKFGKRDMTILILSLCVILYIIACMAYELPKKGYANYTYKETKLQISMNDIYTDNLKEYPSGFIDEESCMVIMRSHSDDAYRSACSYLVVNKKELNMELKSAIEMWNNAWNIVYALSGSFLFLMVFLIKGAFNHQKLNKYIEDKRGK